MATCLYTLLEQEYKLATLVEPDLPSAPAGPKLYFVIKVFRPYQSNITKLWIVIFTYSLRYDMNRISYWITMILCLAFAGLMVFILPNLWGFIFTGLFAFYAGKIESTLFYDMNEDDDGRQDSIT